MITLCSMVTLRVSTLIRLCQECKRRCDVSRRASSALFKSTWVVNRSSRLSRFSRLVAHCWTEWILGCRLAFLTSTGNLNQTSNGRSLPDYGLKSRHAAKAYLAMPQMDRGPFPQRLSQTGAFKDVFSLLAGDS